MRHTYNRRLHAAFVPLAGVIALLPAAATRAQIFDGGGITEGLGQASGVTGVAGDDPRGTIEKILLAVLDFAALFAVIMIILAGFYLIFSLGNDEGKEKAKKIIFYTIIGLVIILFSRIIVSLVTVWLSQQI